MSPLRDRTARLGGRPRAALWACLLALFVQALLPAAAMAAQAGAGRGEQIVVCTLSGVRTVAVGGHETGGKGFAGLPCDNCLAAACAVTPTPEPEIRAAVYACAQVEHAPGRQDAPKLARAPPRPPGQGPPQA